MSFEDKVDKQCLTENAKPSQNALGKVVYAW